MRCFLVLVFILNLFSGFAQRFETGLLSGMGFTDFHGESGSGKWQSMTGPVSGVFFRYSLSPVLSVSTELTYSVQEYYYKPYQYYQPYYYPAYAPYDQSLYLRYDPNYAYYVNQHRWDFGFWRIPVYLTLSTPTRLQLSVSAGVYLSFTQHQEHSSNYWYPYPWFRSSLYPPSSGYEAPKHDNGMLYAASLSYPLSGAFRAFIQGRYFIGHREFIEPQQGRTGVSEVVFGVGYNGLFKSKKNPAAQGAGNDTALSRFTVTPRFGLNLAGIKGSGWPEAYAVKPGASVAVGLEFRLDRNFSLVSGLGFDRKGYRLQDSSIYYFLHAAASWPLPLHHVDTRVDLDYATIPLQLKISMGSGTRVYLLAGAYWGIKLNARVTGTAELENASEYGYSRNAITVYDDIERYIRNNDFGWLFGAGVEVPVFRGNKLELGVQYALGKTDILREDELNHDLLTGSEDVLRNGSLMIHAGFAFPIPSAK